MKRLLLLLALLAGVAHAIAPDKLTLGKEPVVDQAAMLAPAETAALNQKLRTLHEAQVMQGAIVLIDNLNGMSDFDYGMAVFQRWQLGDRTRDDGLLILLSQKEHAIRIITGRGLEGDIPDIYAKKIINAMVPQFKQGHFAAGLESGVDTLAAHLQADAKTRAANLAASRGTESGMGAQIPIFAAFILFVILRKLDDKTTKKRRKKSRRRNDDDDDDGSALFTGAVVGSSFSSSSSSTSSSDYSGGGGSSSGGGAGGTW
ncbi:TPM domain-containing protein [Cardiobacterium hominis]|uniref:TPM domain-containing protein n=1 Tax=Cardiobacterium hominis TaxID=2718 RepID=UPI0028D25D64|nr:TPM domain-containing protein [Cardiobacterium hominis]